MQELYTIEGENLEGIPWNSYPRPQLKREKWLNLNGKWDLIINDKKEEILVPFSPESLLSGNKGPVPYGETIRYHRTFEIPKDWDKQRVLLHFGAVNRVADISVNGKHVFHHENGYLPFSIDITDELRDGENDLTVSVVNDVSHKHPWGKQKIDRGGMWYTPSSGIWQTVWLEPVPEENIKKINIDNSLDSVDISVEGLSEGTLILEDKEYPITNGKVHVDIEEPVLWSPENPYLYHFKIKGDEDEVESYFALRTISTGLVNGKERILLNGKPYFFHGLLDQGYWSDGIYTPATPEGFEIDINSMKDLGFNMLRKHIKIEPEQFYYDADRLGMIVFQDMVNAGEYHYVRDTALPTIGLLERNDEKLQNDPETRKNFLESMDKTVDLLKNHPSIVLWTIFNEGWGQFEADKAYERLKKQDDSRLIDSTSGWFHQEKSDVDSLHVYFRKLHLGDEPKPQFLSEFGGYSYKIPEHSFNLDKTYGYRKYENREDFVQGIRDLYLEELLPLIPEGLSAAVLTQVSDVEDETNGLLTYDRKEAKIYPEEFRDISEKLIEAGSN